jgi:fumarylacetoacetase
MSGFGLENLPYGVFSTPGAPPRVGVAYLDGVVDLHRLLDDSAAFVNVFAQPNLNAFLARGPRFWAQVRDAVAERVVHAPRVPFADATMHLPVSIGDFVDFYSSMEHATNVSRILRPTSPGLQPNWRELPVGYHGRAGTVVVSGTPVRRPRGQVPTGARPQYRPTARLDVEVELGFIVGVDSTHGIPVTTDEFTEHVFGAVIVLDWSARDIQAWEYQPLGPFLGKSFATTMGAWVVPLAALEEARVPAPVREPEPLPHLREPEFEALAAGALHRRGPWSLAISYEFSVNGVALSTPDYRGMYWSAAQQLAHLTSNGASVRTGDLYASGTISSFDPSGMGCLIELTHDGQRPITMPDGTELGYLRDGDVIQVRAAAHTGHGAQLSLGEASATIVAAL